MCSFVLTLFFSRAADLRLAQEMGLFYILWIVGPSC